MPSLERRGGQKGPLRNQKSSRNSCRVPNTKLRLLIHAKASFRWASSGRSDQTRRATGNHRQACAPADNQSAHASWELGASSASILELILHHPLNLRARRYDSPKPLLATGRAISTVLLPFASPTHVQFPASLLHADPGAAAQLPKLLAPIPIQTPNGSYSIWVKGAWTSILLYRIDIEMGSRTLSSCTPQEIHAKNGQEYRF